MTKRRWFRIAVDGAGKVLDCRPVGDEGTAELGVFYVLAASAQAAAKAAANKQAAKLLAARRARYRAEGLCDCGSKRDRPGLKTCARCAERHAVHNERLRLKAKGIAVPPADRREVLLEKKQADADRVRFETLLEVQKELGRNRNNHRGFERWLAGEVEKLTTFRKTG